MPPLASGKPWVFVQNWREAVFPKVDTPYGQALTGLRVDGPLGRRFLRGLSLTRLWREGCCRAPLNYIRRQNLNNRPAGEKMQSPFGSWRHHLARWEACHWIRGSRGSPMNPVPLPPPQFGGATKGKRLNGQARRLTSPHLEVLCRTSTGDYKAPLCCELLMKGLLCVSLLSHRSAGERWCRKAPKGGKATGGG